MLNPLVGEEDANQSVPPANLSILEGQNLLRTTAVSSTLFSVTFHIFCLTWSTENPVRWLKGDCSVLEGERWWAAYLWEGLALLKWNSLVLSDRAMEADRGLVWGPVRAEDLKRRISVFSFPPFFTFTFPCLLIIYPHPSSSAQSRTGQSVSIASRDLPWGSQMGCQAGAGPQGTKELRKHTEKGQDPGKMCLIAPLNSDACMECMPRSEHKSSKQLPRLSLTIFTVQESF